MTVAVGICLPLVGEPDWDLALFLFLFFLFFFSSFAALMKNGLVLKMANGSFYELWDLADDRDLEPDGDLDPFLVLCTLSGFPMTPIFIPMDLSIPGCGEYDLLGDLPFDPLCDLLTDLLGDGLLD